MHATIGPERVKRRYLCCLRISQIGKDRKISWSKWRKISPEYYTWLYCDQATSLPPWGGFVAEDFKTDYYECCLILREGQIAWWDTDLKELWHEHQARVAKTPQVA